MDINMLSLTNRAAVEAAINDAALDPALRDLLALRARQLEDDTEPDVELNKDGAIAVGEPEFGERTEPAVKKPVRKAAPKKSDD